jgi:hypothetical protein
LTRTAALIAHLLEMQQPRYRLCGDRNQAVRP